MTKELVIGANKIRLCGNGATAIRFKQVFNRDLLVSFAEMDRTGYDFDVLKQLAFVMSKQAEGADFPTITYEDFIDWLEQFEEADLVNAMPEIIDAWMTNASTKVKSKKK